MSFPRQRPQRVETYIGVYQPPTVLAAQVNNGSAAKGDRAITYDNATGDYTKVVSGMTCYIGTTPGGKDIGRIRVRSATSTVLTIAENSILWQDNLYLTVVKFWEPWGVYPFIELDDPLSLTANPIFYKDRDILYTDQNTDMDPVVNMGYHQACFAGECLEWSASGSFGPSGATLNTYAWEFEGGTPTGSSLLHPGQVCYPDPGQYTTKCTITDSNAKQFTGYRHTLVFPRPYGTFGHWGVQSWEGSRDTGGYNVRFWVREAAGADKVTDGALVIIFSEAWYANSYVQHQIRFVGYVDDDSIRFDAVTSLLTFDAKSITGTAAGRDTFSGALDSTAVPSGTFGWTQMPDVTVDKAVIAHLRWQSTLLSVADFYRSNDTRLIQFADLTRGPIYNAVQQLYSSAILANLVSNKRGQMFAEIDVNYQPTGTARNIPIALDVERIDWRDEPEIDRVQSPSVSYVELGGVGYSGDATGTFGAWLSGAPGDAPGYFGSPQQLTGLAINGQDDLNRLSGLYYADQINEFPNVHLPLSGDYDDLDIAPQTWVRMSLGVQDTWRRLVWNLKRFVPQRLSFTVDHRRKSFLVDVDMKAETWGPPGDTVIIPVDPPYDPPDYGLWQLPVVQPVVAPSGDVKDLVYVVTTNKIARTRNFTAVTPNYVNATGAVTGTIADFILDPFDPKNKAWCITSTGVWKTSNLDSTIPTWTQNLTVAQIGTLIASDTNVTNMDLHAIKAIITASGNFAIYLYTIISGVGRLNTLRTANNGSSWTSQALVAVFPYVGSWPDATLGFDWSQHGSNKMYAGWRHDLFGANSARVTRSDNNGVSWNAEVGTGGGNASVVTDLLIPYNDNPSDSIVYEVEHGSAGNNVRKSIDSGATWSLITPSGFGGGSGIRYAIHAYTQDRNIMFVTDGTSFWYSSDGGIIWTLRSTFSNSRAFGGFPYNGGRVFRLRNANITVAGLGADPAVWTSADGGYTWTSKTGDWGAAIGNFNTGIMIVPVWTE